MTDERPSESIPRLRQWLPITGWLPAYQKQWLPLDLVAGLTVWALIVPEAMAYAGIAGVPVQFGLYAVPLALVGYAVFGSCRELFVGPSATVASMSAATVGGIALASSNGNSYIELTALLALTVGLLYLVGGILRMGFIANFFARPVLDGFIIGLGLFIAIGQLPKLVGITKPSGDSVQILVRTLTSISDWNPATVLVGAIGLLILFGLKRFAPRLPAAIIVVVLALIAVPMLDLKSHGVDVVGTVPTGFNFVPYSGLSWSDIGSLIPGALAIVIVGFAQSVAIAKAYASEHRYSVDASQEMIGYGAANVGAGLLQGYTVTGSLSKSAAAQEARARTPISTLFTAGMVLLTILFLAGLFANLPEAVLAAIVIEAVSGMLKFDKLATLWRAHSVEFWAALGALAGVVVIGIMAGVVIGVAVSFALLIHTLDHPLITRLGANADASAFVDADVNDGSPVVTGVIIERFEAPLVFSNADLFQSEMLHRVHAASPAPRALVVDFEAVTQLDLTGAYALGETRETLEREGVRLVIARPHGLVREQMERTGVLAAIGAENIQPTVREALAAAVELLDAPTS